MKHIGIQIGYPKVLIIRYGLIGKETIYHKTTPTKEIKCLFFIPKSKTLLPKLQKNKKNQNK
jgi:hypothetical protein